MPSTQIQVTCLNQQKDKPGLEIQHRTWEVLFFFETRLTTDYPEIPVVSVTQDSTGGQDPTHQPQWGPDPVTMQAGAVVILSISIWEVLCSILYRDTKHPHWHISAFTQFLHSKSGYLQIYLLYLVNSLFMGIFFSYLMPNSTVETQSLIT
jgi:hypothetical protein